MELLHGSWLVRRSLLQPDPRGEPLPENPLTRAYRQAERWAHAQARDDAERLAEEIHADALAEIDRIKRQRKADVEDRIRQVQAHRERQLAAVAPEIEREKARRDTMAVTPVAVPPRYDHWTPDHDGLFFAACGSGNGADGSAAMRAEALGFVVVGGRVVLTVMVNDDPVVHAAAWQLMSSVYASAARAGAGGPRAEPGVG